MTVHDRERVGGYLDTTSGETVHAVLVELVRCFPGIRFCIVNEQDGIHPHIKLFINSEPVRSLAEPVGPDATLHLIAALSGR